jgi:hypothetical protein
VSCNEVKDTSKRNPSKTKSEGEGEVAQKDETLDESFKIVRKNESATVSLGDDAKVDIAEGTAEETIRVTLRRVSASSLENNDAIQIESAATDALEIEVVSEQSGEVLDRDALKKPLSVTRTVATDRQKESIQPAVTAERSGGAIVTYLVSNSDTEISEASAGLIDSFLLLISPTRLLSYRFNLLETKAQAALVFLNEGSSPNSGSGSQTGTASGTATGTSTGSGTATGGGISPNAIWSGSHASGVALGTLDTSFNFFLDTEDSLVGEFESKFLDFQFGTDGFIYFLSRTPYNSPGITHGGIRRMSASGAIDETFQKVNTYTNLAADTADAFLVAGSYLYFSTIGQSNEVYLSKYDITAKAVVNAFWKREYTRCESANNAGECRVTSIVDCSTDHICIYGRSTMQRPNSKGFFFAKLAKSNGAEIDHYEYTGTSPVTYNAGMGTLHSNGYFYGVTTKLLYPNNTGVTESDLALVRSHPNTTGLFDGTMSVIQYQDDIPTDEANTPIAVVEDSQGDLLLLSNAMVSLSGGPEEQARILKVNPSTGSPANGSIFAGMVGGHGLRITNVHATSIAALPNGRFVVAYQRGADLEKINLRFFNSDGTPHNIFESNTSNLISISPPTSMYKALGVQMRYMGNGWLLVMGHEVYPSTSDLNHLHGFKIAIN